MPVKRRKSAAVSSAAGSSPDPFAALRSAGATMSKAVCANCREFTPWPLVMNAVATLSRGRSRRWLRYPGQEPPWPTKVFPSDFHTEKPSP